METLPNSYLQFRSNTVMNKLDYNLTTLPNELQTYESLMQVKGQQGEANVVTSSRSFHKGSTSGTKPVPSTSSNNKWKKKKGGKGNKTVPKAAQKAKKVKAAKRNLFLLQPG